MVARMMAGKREHDHPGEDQHRPGEDRHGRERHARRARAQHADDDLDRAGDRGNLDEADAEQPEIGADAGRIFSAGQRRIHEPAAGRRQIEKQRAEEDEAADEIGPERIGAQPRKRQVARAEHLRQQHHAHGFDDRHGEQEHHHRAVHGEDLIVGLLAQEGVARHRELRAHQQRENAGEQEKQERGADVEIADDGVVDGADDPPAARHRPDGLQLLQLRCAAAAAGLGNGRAAGRLCAICAHLSSPRYAVSAAQFIVAEDAERRHLVAGLEVLAVGDEAGEIVLAHRQQSGRDRAAAGECRQVRADRAGRSRAADGVAAAASGLREKRLRRGGLLPSMAAARPTHCGARPHSRLAASRSHRSAMNACGASAIFRAHAAIDAGPLGGKPKRSWSGRGSCRPCRRGSESRSCE